MPYVQVVYNATKSLIRSLVSGDGASDCASAGHDNHSSLDHDTQTPSPANVHRSLDVPPSQPQRASMPDSEKRRAGNSKRGGNSILRGWQPPEKDILEHEISSHYLLNDEIEEVSDPESKPLRKAVRRKTPEYRSRQTATDAAVRRRASDEEESGRLLGDRKSKIELDAVPIDLPGSRRFETAMKPKVPGFLRPLNTLERPAPAASSKESYRLQKVRPDNSRFHLAPSGFSVPDPHYSEVERATKRVKVERMGASQPRKSQNKNLNGYHSDDMDELGLPDNQGITPVVSGRGKVYSSVYFQNQGGANNVEMADAPMTTKARGTKSTPRPISNRDAPIELDSEEEDDEFTRNARRERMRDQNLNPRSSPESPISKQSDATRSTDPSLQEVFDTPNPRASARETKESPDVLAGSGERRPSYEKSGREFASEISFGPGRGTNPEKPRQTRRGGQSVKNTATAAEPMEFVLTSLRHGQLLPNHNYRFLVNPTSRTFAVNWPNNNLDKGAVTGWILLDKIRRVLHGEDDCCKVLIETSRNATFHGVCDNTFLLELESPKRVNDLLQLLLRLTPGMKVDFKEDSWLSKFRTGKDFAIYSNATMQSVLRPQREGTSEMKTSPHFAQSGETTVAQRLDKSRAQRTEKSAERHLQRTVISGHQRGHSLQELDSEHVPSHNTENRKHQSAISVQNAGDLERDFMGSRETRARAARQKTSYAEEEMPEKPRRPKFSATGGLGPEWKNPLVFPKEGKRREIVQFNDLNRLDDDEFLNDSLVGFYIRYLEHYLEKHNNDAWKRMHIFNSYFYERLTQSQKGKRSLNYEGVEKWTRAHDLFSRDFIIVPVNENLHWYVAIICNLTYFKKSYSETGPTEEDLEVEEIVDPSAMGDNGSASKAEQDLGSKPQLVPDLQPEEETRSSFAEMSLADEARNQAEQIEPSSSANLPGSQTKRGKKKLIRRSLPKYDTDMPVIITLDSLGTGRSSTCSALRSYIVAEAKSKRNWDIDGGIIKGMTAKNIPSQGNYSDCGIYLCTYLEKFVLNPSEFVRKILQREPQDWPEMYSVELRTRFRDLVMELHRQQEGEKVQNTIPEVGKILLYDKPADVAPSVEPIHVEENSNGHSSPTNSSPIPGLSPHDYDQEGLPSKISRQIQQQNAQHGGGRRSPDDLFDTLNKGVDEVEVAEEQVNIAKGLSHLQYETPRTKRSRNNVIQQARRSSAITIDDNEDPPSSPSDKKAVSEGRVHRLTHGHLSSADDADCEHDSPQELSAYLAERRSPLKQRAAAREASKRIEVTTTGQRSKSVDTDFLHGIGTYAEGAHDEEEAMKQEMEEGIQRAWKARRREREPDEREGRGGRRSERRNFTIEVPDSQEKMLLK